MRRFIQTVLVLVALPAALAAGSPNAASEDDYYQLLRFHLPKGEVIEPGALEWLPNGNLAVGTRRGEIWLVGNALTPNPEQATYTRYARGLHEILGLAAKGDWLYVTERCDVTRIKDTRGEGRADLFEVVSDGWEINGDYHEYAWGSKFDKKGDLWVALCLTGSFTSDSKFRGWCMRIKPDGTMVPTCSGIRSPGGLGMNAEGVMFYTDNQGPWNGACMLHELVPGGFMGHPAGLRWYPYAKNMGPAPLEPHSGSRIAIEARRIPQYVPPSVQFPYAKMGQSASGIACDQSGGKFGPFSNQLFVGDQTHSTVMRVFLEKINGHYQGACFPFRKGFGSGNVPVLFAPDGSLFVGGTNRGWGSRGPHPFALERLVWTGKTPFEMKEMKARPDGFELTFTQPVDPVTAGDPHSYQMNTFTYIFQASYGSPEVDPTTPTIERAVVSNDRRSVRLYVAKRVQGHIHELHAPGVRSATGLPLLHAEAYYTLNEIPGK